MEIKKATLKFNYNKMAKLNPKNVYLIILHHSASENTSVEMIHKVHLNNGWAGIGYHYYIREDGTVYEGRPTAYVGSHCPANNSKSIGICLEGDFRKRKPTDKQIKSMNELIVELRKKFTGIARVLNHKDLYATLCPVVNLKGMVDNTNERGDFLC